MRNIHASLLVLQTSIIFTVNPAEAYSLLFGVNIVGVSLDEYGQPSVGQSL